MQSTLGEAVAGDTKTGDTSGFSSAAKARAAEQRQAQNSSSRAAFHVSATITTYYRVSVKRDGRFFSVYSEGG